MRDLFPFQCNHCQDVISCYCGRLNRFSFVAKERVTNFIRLANFRSTETFDFQKKKQILLHLITSLGLLQWDRWVSVCEHCWSPLQLFPRRCTWLYVMNNCLLSISGEFQLYNTCWNNKKIVFFVVNWLLSSLFHCIATHLIAGKASQLYSHSLSGLFEQARQLQKLPVAIPTHKLPDKMIPRWEETPHSSATRLLLWWRHSLETSCSFTFN